jgi:voltage-gated potassium channel
MVRLPELAVGPLVRILRRLAVALGLLIAVALVAYIGRDGYVDADGNAVSLLDAFYYATVSVTTTGYGDIRPESPEARLVNTLLVTPARVLFLIILVGTTLEVLAESTRKAFRVTRWRRMLSDHVIICGYGTKGRSAVKVLLGHEIPKDQIVAIDDDPRALDAAQRDGIAAIAGSASRADVLELAGIRRARAVVVAASRDDASVLITLTARELNPDVTISAAVREEENVHLLRQSGATSVVLSSGAAGRLLGLATQSPATVDVIDDLLTVGEGLDLADREIRPDEVGPLADLHQRDPVLAVIRDGEVLRYDDERAADLRAGDRVVYLCSR